MSARAPEHWPGQRKAQRGEQIEEDLAHLRQLVLERHDVRVPVHDPICIEFTVFSQVVERAVSALQQERRETVDELRSILQSTNYAVRMTLEDAGRPLAKAMSDTFDPRSVANRIMAEVFDDLKRECKKAVIEARRIMAVTAGITLAVSFLVLYLASQRLATAEALLHLTDGTTNAPLDPPPPPPDRSER